MAPEVSAAFAEGRRSVRFRQAMLWKLKKAAKALGGGAYLKAREAVLRGR
jgi:hypothetical protein